MSVTPARTPFGQPLPTPQRAVAALIVVTALGASLAPQAGRAEPIEDWRTANDTVGRFERGHIDLLRWEAEHLPAAPAPEAPDASPWTLNEAIVAAQRTRPDWIARPGLSALERAHLQGRQRELALQVERAWLQAVLARHNTALQRTLLQAAEAGHELALRMARVGNWPEARRQREALALLDAQAQLRLAEHAERVAVLELWRLTGAALPVETLARRLPADLPESDPFPSEQNLSALEQTALQQHPTWPALMLQAQRARQAVGDLQPLLTALHAATEPDPATGTPQALPSLGNITRWPHDWDRALLAHLEADALERRIRADVRMAYSAWQTAHMLAQVTATEAARLHTALEEDMLQRYNGMFKSTWDLLAASRTRLQAVHATQQARLNAALARADLRAVLDGLPYTGASPRANTTAPAADKGH